MDDLTARSRTASDDPLQRFVTFLDLYAEAMDEMEDLHPGCLVAAILYQEQAFDSEVRRTLFDTAMRWRARFRQWFQEIEKKYRPKTPLDLDTIADSFSAMVEGSIVLTRALNDRTLLGRQLRLFRDMVKTTYEAK